MPPLPLPAQTYDDASLPFSAQRLVNCIRNSPRTKAPSRR